MLFVLSYFLKSIGETSEKISSQMDSRRVTLQRVSQKAKLCTILKTYKVRKLNNSNN